MYNPMQNKQLPKQCELIAQLFIMTLNNYEIEMVDKILDTQLNSHCRYNRIADNIWKQDLTITQAIELIKKLKVYEFSAKQYILDEIKKEFWDDKHLLATNYN